MSRGIKNITMRLITDDFGILLTWRRCPQCRAWKPQAIGYFSPRRRDEQRRVVRWDPYCLPCRRAQRREAWNAKTAEERAVISRRRWERLKSDPGRLTERRRSNRELMARRREDPELAERQRESRRAWYQRVMADPAQRAAYLERSRMNYRLRQEQIGRGLHTLRLVSGVAQSSQPKIAPFPAAPLLVAIDRHIRAGQLDEDSLLVAGIEPRTIRRWRSGESDTVRFATADAVLTWLGLHWWDVWPPERFPDVADSLETETRAA